MTDGQRNTEREGRAMSDVNRKNPTLAIQPGWEEVIKATHGDIWICFKKIGESRKYGSIGSNLTTSRPFRVASYKNRAVSIVHEDPNCECLFVAPVASFSSIHNMSVLGLDVTPGGLGVSVCDANTIKVWETGNGDTRRTLTGHLLNTYCTRFFPSGLVILTGGADMQLKIWSAETGKCAATLKGHTGAVLDLAIVDKGRNVISVSKDGTARLWDCGQSECIVQLAHVANNFHINCCSLMAIDQGLDLGVSRVSSPREVGSENKLLLIGSENKQLSGISLQSRDKVFEYNATAAVNCCSFLSQNSVIMGSQDGVIQMLDIRYPLRPLAVWEESASPALTLLPFRFSQENGFFAGRNDGTCIFHSFNDNNCIQLTGSDCDPVYQIASDGEYIYTACRDSIVRKYRVSEKN